MPLRDTLQQIHERQQREEQISQDKPKWITDWKAAVSSLLAKLREYLSEYEGEGTMTFATSRTRLTEESLGTYEVEAMNIKVGPIVLIVQPVGLMVIGAAGRVDMHRQGRATEPRRVILPY